MKQLDQAKERLRSTLSARAAHLPMPGAGGLSLLEVGKAFFASLKYGRMGERAAAISFNFLMAIPPTLIFLFSLVPYLPLDSVEETIIRALHILSPNPKLRSAIEDIVVDFMNNKRRELMSIGFVFTLFVSSNGVMGLLRSFDRISPAHRARSGMARRWKAIGLTMGFILIFLVSIALLILQSNLLDQYWLELFKSPLLIKALSGLTLTGLIYISYCVLYRYGPSLHDHLGLFSIGALVATVLFILISYGFFFIAAHFINYNKVYGSLGTLLMFMAWIFIAGWVTLIGFEINLSVLLTKSGRLPPAPPVDGIED